VKLKLASFAIVCGLVSGIGWASSSTTDTETQAQIKSIQKQIQDLNQQVKQLPASQQRDMQQQINELQTEVDQIKSQPGTKPAATGQATTATTKDHYDWSKILNDLYPRSPFVFTTPYLGVPTYDASDLITNWPSINEDLTILGQRKKIADALAQKGRTAPDRPLLDISGYVEGKVFTYNNYNSSSIKSGIDASSVELDLLAEINSWASAYVALDYQSYAPPVGYTASNSAVYVDRAFLTIGNLKKTPFYGSIGQINVPFGTYDNFFITDPLTLTLAKTKEKAVVLGYAGTFGLSNLYAQVYTFAGEAYTNSSGTINNGGVNVGYKYNGQNFNTHIGAGVIMNIADAKNSQGSYSQGNESPTNAVPGTVPGGFQGFGFNNGLGAHNSEHIDHNVPALDLHATFAMFSHYNIFAEYITALRSFDVNDLSYNGDGALVSAFNLEFGYTNFVFSRPYTLAVGYEQSWQSLALSMPQYRAAASAAISFWRNTVEKIEYYHDINYNSSDTASGGGLYHPVNSLGSQRNTVQAVIDFYF
jgi:hypothetical protein